MWTDLFVPGVPLVERWCALVGGIIGAVTLIRCETVAQAFLYMP
jgi:hypothetical protein